MDKEMWIDSQLITGDSGWAELKLDESVLLMLNRHWVIDEEEKA